MSLYAQSSGGNFELCPAGVHLARCYRIVDLGTQKTEYMGQIKHLHKVMLAWEIHGTDEYGDKILMNDGRPFAIFKNYTLSWSEKANLRLDLQAWRGKPFSKEEMQKFDLKNVLGAWCMLNVIHREGNTGKTYANVGGITPVPAVIKQAGLPDKVNKDELFTIENADMAMFNSFSDNLKEKISNSPEWKKAQGAAQPKAHVAEEEIDEEIPF